MIETDIQEIINKAFEQSKQKLAKQVRLKGKKVQVFCNNSEGFNAWVSFEICTRCSEYKNCFGDLEPKKVRALVKNTSIKEMEE